jgi:hypothetical protein
LSRSSASRGNFNHENVATRLLLLTAVRSLLTVSAGTLLLVSALGSVAGLTLTTGSVTGLALSGVSTLEACVS